MLMSSKDWLIELQSELTRRVLLPLRSRTGRFASLSNDRSINRPARADYPVYQPNLPRLLQPLGCLDLLSPRCAKDNLALR